MPFSNPSPGTMTESAQDLRSKLNNETGRLTWKELERHFARGVVIRVAAGMDLVEVAVCIARDDTAALEGWMRGGQVARATVEEAQAWHARQAEFWAVVTAPWVLVQEMAH